MLWQTDNLQGKKQLDALNLQEGTDDLELVIVSLVQSL